MVHHDQRYNASTWMPLGEYVMEPGQGHKIVISNDSLDGPITADAIRFEVVDDLPAVYADAVKLVSNDGEAVNYVHPDHLGAPQKMTDADRNIVWDANYLPFGEEESIIGSAANDNRFPGQRLEAETGLHYNYFRDFDPTTGRYLQSDPIGLAGGINTYGYVSGNPVNYVDPLGLDETKVLNTTGGRSVLDGPTNGNWGGKCWSGGRYSCGNEGPGSEPPTDSGDACYFRHDMCYVKCAFDPDKASCKATCNRKLVDELKKLDDDPKKWKNPPRPGTEKDTDLYRSLAKWYFK